MTTMPQEGRNGMSESLDRLRERSIGKLGDDDALEHIATLIDASAEASFGRGADRAIHLLDELAKRELSARNGAVVEYFRANAWFIKEEVAGDRSSWTWEHPEREQQVLALARAAAHPGFAELEPIRRCQILTNRANQLKTMGRFVDAIEGWDEAIAIIPRFAMAQGNRGYGLNTYGGLLGDDRTHAMLLLHAYDGMVSASTRGAVYDANYPKAVRDGFAAAGKRYRAVIDLPALRDYLDHDGPPLGRSKAERAYRRWCLKARLFLNPLNDVGAIPLAAFDDLVLPPIRESRESRTGPATPPPLIAFFNQMKQEYVSARFMLFEGAHDTALHFSDRRVQLFDTLDYPIHALATERIRTAYRVAYSLLDKVAFLVDHYWQLGKTADRINFKNVWMAEGKPRLLNRFESYANWPLRGLYWLSKELFDEELKQTTAPDSRQLHDIRNALEHKFLQVHLGWAWPLVQAAPASAGLALSIDSDLLEAKALRVLKMARSALIQVVLAIGVEERARNEDTPPGIVASMSLFGLDDRRKRRDPN